MIARGTSSNSHCAENSVLLLSWNKRWEQRVRCMLQVWWYACLSFSSSGSFICTFGASVFFGAFFVVGAFVLVGASVFFGAFVFSFFLGTGWFLAVTSHVVFFFFIWPDSSEGSVFVDFRFCFFNGFESSIWASCFCAYTHTCYACRFCECILRLI